MHTDALMYSVFCTQTYKAHTYQICTHRDTCIDTLFFVKPSVTLEQNLMIICVFQTSAKLVLASDTLNKLVTRHGGPKFGAGLGTGPSETGHSIAGWLLPLLENCYNICDFTHSHCICLYKLNDKWLLELWSGLGLGSITRSAIPVLISFLIRMGLW